MSPDRKLPELPPEFQEAKNFYKDVLQQDPQWMKDHLGKYVAIIGQKVVDETSGDEKFIDLSIRVRREYGYGPIFMPEVRKEPRVVNMGPGFVVKQSPGNS